MHNFTIIILKTFLQIYEKSSNKYEQIYINGSSEYPYKLNSIKADIEKLVHEIVNEYNMDSTADINFEIVSNEDASCTNKLLNVFNICNYNINKTYEITKFLPDIICNLSKDKSLLITEYGINYDSNNYILCNNSLEKKDFSLLAYTFTPDNIIAYLS